MIKLLYKNGYRLDHYISNPNIERTINGPYFLEFELPIDYEIANLIEENMEIESSIPNNETDLFRVRLIRKDLDAIYFYCTQVFFSLEDNFIEDTNIVSKNGLGAMLQISSNTQYAHNFNFFSDIGTVKNARMVRKNVVSAILGSEDNSFINRWGGELDIHKYDVKMLTKLGADRGVTIEYRKNLTGLDGTIDYSTYYTRCMPQGFDGLFLEEKYVDSPNINKAHPIIKVVEFSDIKVKENEEDEDGYATKEEAQKVLREAVNKLYEDGADSPKGSYNINFVELTKTEEYKNYSILERIWIGDTVTVKHDTFNVKARCMQYSYNPISCMYNSLTLGETVEGIIERNNSIKDKIDSVVDTTKDDYARYMEKAIEEATALINSGLGGHAYKTRNEFLILDTEDIMTAVKVLRINQNGIGFSATGYNGPYTTAMTADGKLVISEVTANKFTAALINTGILTSANGKVQIGIGDDTGVAISGGALTVTNDNGTVVIDGSSNMFKIQTIFEVQLDAGDDLSYEYRIRHGFGYVPAYVGYQVASESFVGISNTLLPALSVTSTNGDVLGYTSILRANADENDIIISFVRANTTHYNNPRVKIFVYKEALI